MLFFDCNIKINNTQADNARDLDAVMLLYNLIEYSGCYTKTSGGLWQYHKDDLNDNTTDSESFKFKERTTRRSLAAGNINDLEIAVQLKCSSNFMRILETPLTNCLINSILSCSANFIIKFNRNRIAYNNWYKTVHSSC